MRTLPSYAGKIMIAIARASIGRVLGVDYEVNDGEDWLGQTGATFVTLTQNNMLRGCIGTLEAYRPLMDDIAANAIAAAFRDPRFSPLTRDELSYTLIEVSLLSDMQPIVFSNEEEALSQIRPGIDGIVFEVGHFRSTFLPQVWDQLPDRTEFMANLKRKAGLSATFWSDDVRLLRYQVSKWKEEEEVGSAN